MSSAGECQTRNRDEQSPEDEEAPAPAPNEPDIASLKHTAWALRNSHQQMR